MVTLVTADLHLSENPRDSYRLDFLKRLGAMIIKNKADNLVILGDLTEAKDRHNATLVNKLVDGIQALATLCPITIIRGNHDGLLVEYPFFRFLSHINGITWINNPTGDKVRRGWLFLPHTSDYQRDWKGLDLAGWSYIFCHNTFAGTRGDNNHLLDGIPVKVFPAKARVISGDIHSPQEVGPVTYVGAPYLIDFGDSYEPRVLLLDGKTMTSIKCHGPQKRLIEVGSMMDLKVGAFFTDKGDIVKVRVTVDPAQHAEWPEAKKAVRKFFEDQGIRVDSVAPTVKVTGRAKVKSTSKKTASDDDLLASYAKARGVDDRTLDTGLWLIEQ